MLGIAREIVAEIGREPVTFAIELVQFGLLVAIAYVVAFGIGRRKGTLASMLADRGRGLAERVERAAHADESLADARRTADERLAVAKAEAAGIVRSARATARKARNERRAAADAEAEAIRARAAQILDEERAESDVEDRDRLVALVAQATRAMLAEGLGPAEQRRLIAGIVAGEVDRIAAGQAAAGEAGR